MTPWLRCRVNKGMFSDEVAVTYPPSAMRDWQKSVFVSRSFVREVGSGYGDVMVKIAEHDGATYALLPTQDDDVVKAEEADLTFR
jgi:hypothetical protein